MGELDIKKHLCVSLSGGNVIQPENSSGVFGEITKSYIVTWCLSSAYFMQSAVMKHFFSYVGILMDPSGLISLYQHEEGKEHKFSVEKFIFSDLNQFLKLLSRIWEVVGIVEETYEANQATDQFKSLSIVEEDTDTEDME